ncbi:hypothetical protein [Streptomyces cinerochromogenes]|uniref:hypothetical protein n=1 Tax=Streptomyces cinerochromogenes TaxID=66422 RepID=UPI00339F5C40
MKGIKRVTIGWCTAGALFAVACVAGPALLLEESEGPQISPSFDYKDSSPESRVTEPPNSATTEFSTFIACPGVLGTSISFTEDVVVVITSRDVTSDLAVTELSVGSPGFGKSTCQARILLSGPALPKDLQIDGSVPADADSWTPRSVTVPLGEDVTLVWQRTNPDEWIVEAG